MLTGIIQKREGFYNAEETMETEHAKSERHKGVRGMGFIQEALVWG